MTGASIKAEPYYSSVKALLRGDRPSHFFASVTCRHGTYYAVPWDRSRHETEFEALRAADSYRAEVESWCSDAGCGPLPDSGRRGHGTVLHWTLGGP